MESHIWENSKWYSTVAAGHTGFHVIRNVILQICPSLITKWIKKKKAVQYFNHSINKHIKIFPGHISLPFFFWSTLKWCFRFVMVGIICSKIIMYSKLRSYVLKHCRWCTARGIQSDSHMLSKYYPVNNFAGCSAQDGRLKGVFWWQAMLHLTEMPKLLRLDNYF